MSWALECGVVRSIRDCNFVVGARFVLIACRVPGRSHAECWAGEYSLA